MHKSILPTTGMHGIPDYRCPQLCWRYRQCELCLVSVPLPDIYIYFLTAQNSNSASSFTPVQDCTAYLRHLKWALNSLNVFDSSLWQFVFAFSPIGTFLLHLCINVQHYIIFTKQNKLSCNIFVALLHPKFLDELFLNILRWNWAMEPSAHKAGDPVDNWITHVFLLVSAL